MEEKKNRLGAFLKSLGSGERRVKLIVIVGFLGIFLLFLSQFTGKKEETKTEPVGDAAAYTEALQKELTALIGQIKGAGKTTVLVTLQNDWETLYVSGEKTDSAKESSGETVSERLAKEESYVLVDGTNGRSGLVRTRMEPVVKGVVVVCEGGDDPPTVLRILEAVTTALAISSARVCITKCA